jgi:biopolymer transport protein ExbB
MFFATLLQVTLTNGADTAKAIVTTPVTTTAAPTETAISLMDLIVKGGYVMIPIGILLILTVYVFFERLFTVLRASRSERNFMNNVRDLVLSGNVDGAKAFCKNSTHPQARVIEKGLSRIGKPIKEIEEAMEDVGRIELYKLEKNMGILNIAGRVAPMLGFIGTIMGVINIFYKISLAKVVEIDVISEGLYQKMVSSAAGLAIGIFAFICYHAITMIIDKILNKIEVSTVELIDILNEPGK